MKLKLWLRLWQYARVKALSSLREEFSGETHSAGLEFDFITGGRRWGKTRMMNVANRLRDDYRLHDAADDLL